MRRARPELAFVVLLLACNPLAKKKETTEAGAPEPAASGPSTSKPTGTAKTLDATGCDPGTSLDPPDKGKTITTDHFRYTLLDARTDTADALGKPIKVLLVKLQVENVTQKPDLNLSIAEVDVTKNRAAIDRVKDRELLAKTTFFYPGQKMCVNLAADVAKGKIPPGAKVIGYYAYELPEPYTSLWFSARNISPEAVQKGNLLKVVGSFRLK